eukprot:6281-Chlamydomonas_euryale.AAC.2
MNFCQKCALGPFQRNPYTATASVRRGLVTLPASRLCAITSDVAAIAAAVSAFVRSGRCCSWPSTGRKPAGGRPAGQGATAVAAGDAVGGGGCEGDAISAEPLRGTLERARGRGAAAGAMGVCGGAARWRADLSSCRRCCCSCRCGSGSGGCVCSTLASASSAVAC